MSRTQEVRLLAWNLKDGLSDPDRADAIAETVAAIDPDLAIFSEGAPEGTPVLMSARQKLEAHTGRVFQADYEDTDGREDRHRLVAVAKPKFGQPSVLPVYGRNAFFFMNGMLPLVVTGMHGLDRDQEIPKRSDEARIRQVEHVLARLASHEDQLSDGIQSILIGDLNSMYSEDIEARLIRLCAPLFNVLPSKNPGETQNVLERAGSISQRLAQMAIGGPLRVLQEQGYVDSNPAHQGTMQLGPIAVQLDHILAKNVRLYGHERIDHMGLSDHFGIVASADVTVPDEKKSA